MRPQAKKRKCVPAIVRPVALTKRKLPLAQEHPSCNTRSRVPELVKIFFLRLSQLNSKVTTTIRQYTVGVRQQCSREGEGGSQATHWMVLRAFRSCIVINKQLSPFRHWYYR